MFMLTRKTWHSTRICGRSEERALAHAIHNETHEMMQRWKAEVFLTLAAFAQRLLFMVPGKTHEHTPKEVIIRPTISKPAATHAAGFSFTKCEHRDTGTYNYRNNYGNRYQASAGHQSGANTR